MAFRHHYFNTLRPAPTSVKVEKQVSQFDKNGVERVTTVLLDSSDLPIPKPSEYTINFCMSSGALSPVDLSEYVLEASPTEVLSGSFDVSSDPVEPSQPVEPVNEPNIVEPSNPE